MKLDKKGFTVIELILSFIFVMFLAIGMFSLVNSYREREETETIRSELLTLRNTITSDIYKDTTTRKVKKMNYCLDGSNQVIDNCIEIYFMDDTMKQLKVVHEQVKIDDDGHYFDFDSIYFTYGGVKYENPDPVFTTMVSDYMLTYTTDQAHLEYGVIYKINLRIKHQDLSNEFVIDVVTTGVS